jgi:hypothetical protein
MEHLHPDDAQQQLANIYVALKPGGRYYCITPNRFTGPHDVSRFFDDVATGFHLREYSNGELVDLFKLIGFQRVLLYIGKYGFYVRCPTSLKTRAEKSLDALPVARRKFVSRLMPMRLLLRIVIVGEK